MMRPPPRSPPFPYTTLFRSFEPVERRAVKPLRDLQQLADRTAIECARPPQSEHAVAENAPSPELDELLEHDQRHSRSEEHTSELQSQSNLVCRLLLEKKKIR